MFMRYHKMRWKADPLKQPYDPGRDLLGAQAHVAGDPGRRHHADRHGLAMTELPASGGRLERMADRMAEIQNAADPLILFVPFHHSRLDPAGSLDHVGDRVLPSVEDRADVGFEPFEESPIRDHAVLHHFEWL